MGAQHKADGHKAEHSAEVHNLLKQVFGFERVETDGSSQTKTDLFGVIGDVETRFSQKFASGNNTQVWLPTLKSLGETVPEIAQVLSILHPWLGTDDSALFESWKPGRSLTSEEVRRQRVGSDKIQGWEQVIAALNTATQNKSLLHPMMLAKGSEDPVQYLIWIDKKKGTIQVVDVNKHIDYIVENGVWSNSTDKRGEHYNLWCTDKLTGNRLFHLQMKGSGGKKEYHAPMFHIHRHWPKEFVIHEQSNFWIK